MCSFQRRIWGQSAPLSYKTNQKKKIHVDYAAKRHIFGSGVDPDSLNPDPDPDPDPNPDSGFDDQN
jgi:hypothetical protein